VRVIGTSISFISGALQTIQEMNNKVDATGTVLTVGRYCDFNSTCRIVGNDEHQHPNSLSFSGLPLVKRLARNS
jgi:hypothetical protein